MSKKEAKNEPTELSAAIDDTTGAPILDFSNGIDTGNIQEFATYYAIHYAGYLVLAVILAGLAFAAYRTSKNNAETGDSERTIFSKIGEAISFEFKEDARPIIENQPWTRPKYVMLAVIPIIAGFVWPLNWNIPIAIIVIMLCSISLKRHSDIQLAREHALNQIFEIARERLKYKGSADLVKDQYIQITEWRDMVMPSKVTIMYPSSSPVSKDEFRHEFEMHLTSQAIAGVVWDFEWEFANNRVIVTAQPPLPTMAYLPFPTMGEFNWDELPLGVGINGEPISFLPGKCPHSVVAGKSGSGKSVLQRNILIHTLQHPEWNVILIDPKRVELSMYKDADGVIKYAVSEETMNEALEFALEEMSNRYALMEQQGVAFYRRLPDPPNALLVMIDEAASLLLETGDKEIDTLKKRNKVIVGRIAREGRAAGVHLVLATQRPDAKWLGGDTRETIEGRGAMGNMSSSASLMILNNVMATRTPGIKGRGIWFDGNDYHPMQSYFFDEADVSPAIPYCNGLRNGTIDPEELRKQLYPDLNGDGSPDSEEPNFGTSVGALRRVKRWFATQADKAHNASNEDDSDEGSNFNVKEWIAERRKAEKEPDTPLLDEPAPVVVDRVEVASSTSDTSTDWDWSDVEEPEGFEPLYEEIVDEVPVEPKPKASRAQTGEGESFGNLSDSDIASLDRLLRELKDETP
jgi:hypothetical protein